MTFGKRIRLEMLCLEQQIVLKIGREGLGSGEREMMILWSDYGRNRFVLMKFFREFLFKF